VAQSRTSGHCITLIGENVAPDFQKNLAKQQGFVRGWCKRKLAVTSWLPNACGKEPIEMLDKLVL
jgi:hypothetical protein